MYAVLNNPNITDNKATPITLVWTCTENEENIIPKRVLVLNVNLETTRPRVRPRNRWHDEVREDGKIVGGEGWQKNQGGMEESPKNDNELSHSAHAN
jgi:hypothetical protein